MRRHLIESEVTIRRPVEDVWAFSIDLFNSPRLREMSLAARFVTPGPPGLGSVAEMRTVILGFETHLRFTVTEWDPPHAVVASLSGPFLRSAHTRTELTSTTEGTHRVSAVDLELSNAGILLWPLMGRLLRRDQARNDRNLKALLEANPSDTGGG